MSKFYAHTLYFNKAECPSPDHPDHKCNDPGFDVNYGGELIDLDLQYKGDQYFP